MRILKSLATTGCCGVVLCSCSTHPLPEDRTGLSVFDIVHKIQCEAGDALAPLHPDKGALGRSLALVKLNKQITVLKKQIGDTQAKLPTAAELKEANESIVLRARQLDEQYRLALVTKKGNELETILELIRDKLGRLVEEKKNIEKKASEVKKLQVLIGNLKELEKNKIKGGQFYDLVKFESKTATFQFTFTVTENNDATSDGMITWPIVVGNLPGAFTIGYDVGEKKQRKAKRLIKSVMLFGDLYRMSCADVVAAGDEPLPRKYPITGDIGLAEVFLNYKRVSDSGKVNRGIASYQDTITFTTTLNGSVTPSINLARGPRRRIQADATFSAVRSDVHELFLELAPPATKSPAPAQKIVIEQMPQVRAKTRIEELPPKY